MAKHLAKAAIFSSPLAAGSLTDCGIICCDPVAKTTEQLILKSIARRYMKKERRKL